MKITNVKYSFLANLGDYQNERIELEATLEEGDNWEDVLEDLKTKVHIKAKSREDYWKYVREYDTTERKCKEIRKELIEWEAKHREAATFMVGQGLKTPEQIQAFPFKKKELLPPATEEIEGEVVSNYGSNSEYDKAK